MYREELIKYFGWHDLFVLWRGCFRKTLVYREELIKYFVCHDCVCFMAWRFQEDAGIMEGVDKILCLA